MALLISYGEINYVPLQTGNSSSLLGGKLCFASDGTENINVIYLKDKGSELTFHISSILHLFSVSRVASRSFLIVIINFIPPICLSRDGLPIYVESIFSYSETPNSHYHIITIG